MHKSCMPPLLYPPLHVHACPLQDSQLKVWGWEGDQLCAYKDDQLQPIAITKLPTRLQWSDAPRCQGAASATMAARDKLNRLWGWERSRCAGVRAVAVAYCMQRRMEATSS